MRLSLSNPKLFFKRNASTILTCTGAIGVVATTIMAVKATPKALILLEQAEEEKGEKLTTTEAVVVAGPVYIPTVVVGVSTISCIFAANVLNKRNQASITSAYMLLDNSYREYKNKVKEMLGEDGELEIRNEIVKDKYNADDIPEDEDDGLELFYDEFSDRYFRSTLYKVQRAEYELNRNLVMRDYAYLNEFYESLDLAPVEEGFTVGWSVGSNLEYYWQEWIDFGHSKVLMDDGLECTIIYMMHEPRMDFDEYC